MKKCLITVMTAAVLSGCVATVTPIGVPPPPPAQSEVIGVTPYPGAVWAGGVWIWHPRRHKYVWRRGYWH